MVVEEEITQDDQRDNGIHNMPKRGKAGLKQNHQAIHEVQCSHNDRCPERPACQEEHTNGEDNGTRRQIILDEMVIKDSNHHQPEQKVIHVVGSPAVELPVALID